MEYWKKLNPDGTTRSVESCSHPHKVPDAIKITKKEFDSFIASLPPPPEPIPPRDLATEIDDIKIRLDKLERRVK